MSVPSPWQGLTPEQLAKPDHDPVKCGCELLVSSPAALRGRDTARRAEEALTLPPMG